MDNQSALGEWRQTAVLGFGFGVELETPATGPKPL